MHLVFVGLTIILDGFRDDTVVARRPGNVARRPNNACTCTGPTWPHQQLYAYILYIHILIIVLCFCWDLDGSLPRMQPHIIPVWAMIPFLFVGRMASCWSPMTRMLIAIIG